MKNTNLMKKMFLTLGVLAFSINLLFAGVPDDETIILFQTENQVKFTVQDQNQSTITQALYFKVDVENNTTILQADFCGSDFCNYSFSSVGLAAGIYQIQVYVEGYSQPATKSFVIN